MAVPVSVIWWTLAGVAWWRRAPADGAELQQRYGRALVAVWVSLIELLPAHFAWVWADRVQWLVF